jgi:hypothetical protein
MGRWLDPSGKTSVVEWVKDLRDKLQPFAHGVYVNQLGDTSEDLVRAAYGFELRPFGRDQEKI